MLSCFTGSKGSWKTLKTSCLWLCAGTVLFSYPVLAKEINKPAPYPDLTVMDGDLECSVIFDVIADSMKAKNPEGEAKALKIAADFILRRISPTVMTLTHFDAIYDHPLTKSLKQKAPKLKSYWQHRMDHNLGEFIQKTKECAARY